MSVNNPKELIIKFFDCNGVYSEITFNHWKTSILFTPNGKIFIPFEEYKKEFSELEKQISNKVREFLETFFFKNNIEENLEFVELEKFIESLEHTKELYSYDILANSIEPVIVQTDLINNCENFEVLKIEYK